MASGRAAIACSRIANDSACPPAAIWLKSSRIEVFSGASTEAANQSVRSYSPASETTGACGGDGWMRRNSTASAGWLTRCRVTPPTVIPGSADSLSHASATSGIVTSSVKAPAARIRASRSRVPLKVSGMAATIRATPDAPCPLAPWRQRSLRVDAPQHQ
jgi:hypothetical protein